MITSWKQYKFRKVIKCIQLHYFKWSNWNSYTVYYTVDLDTFAPVYRGETGTGWEDRAGHSLWDSAFQSWLHQKLDRENLQTDWSCASAKPWWAGAGDSDTPDIFSSAAVNRFICNKYLMKALITHQLLCLMIMTLFRFSGEKSWSYEKLFVYQIKLIYYKYFVF